MERRFEWKAVGGWKGVEEVKQSTMCCFALRKGVTIWHGFGV